MIFLDLQKKWNMLKIMPSFIIAMNNNEIRFLLNAYQLKRNIQYFFAFRFRFGHDREFSVD